VGKKILIGGASYLKYGTRAKAFLEEHGYEAIVNPTDRPFNPEEMAKLVPEISAGLVACENYSDDILAQASKLEVLVKFGVGVDNIDLQSAKRHGVKVANARGRNSDSVAELTIGLVLAVYRNMAHLDSGTRAGKWPWAIGHTIHGKKIGIIGFGAIAQYVAKLFKCFEPESIYAMDLYPNLEAAEKLNVTITDFDTIIKECDIITIHVPQTPQTTKMFGVEQFKIMKNNAILVNIARGAVVDGAALYQALVNGEIAGAGLDVFEVEPADSNNPLFKLKNVAVTPHVGGETYETYDAISMFAVEAIHKVLNGGTLPNWLNP